MRPRLLPVVLVLTALGASAAALPAAAESRAPRPAARLSKPVRIGPGLVTGILSSDGLIAIFRGIPFAAAPVGSLRWKPPQPVPDWDGVRRAVEFGAACPQVDRGDAGDRTARTSEDCLYLNVWAPAKPSRRGVPVMVWFHGGAFTHGTASTPAYDGEALARRGVVVVTFNYRLGPFGFLAHPLLSRESGRDVSGNYGLLDQLEVLRWVKANARAFGGRPDKVTVFGQAAGSVSIGCLLASPLARGLFHAAILESGTPVSIPRIGVTRWMKDPPAGEESMEDVGELVARRLGCDHEADVLAALRARSTEDILAASRPAPNFLGEGLRFGPVIDRWLIPDRPDVLFRGHELNKVPVIVGANAGEGSAFAAAVQPSTVEGYRRFVRSTFRDAADQVLGRFPVTRDADVRAALSRLVGGAGFLAPARRTAQAIAAAGQPAYLYWFTREGSERRRAAGHGAEVPFVFSTLGRGRPDSEDADQELSLLLMGYWVRFARTGNPNGDNAPEWPRYRRAADRAMVFDDQAEARPGMYRDTLDFFDRIAADRASAAGEPPQRAK